MEKIAILTDSNSGLSREEAEKQGIHILPMTFSVGGQEHKEGITLTDREFFDSMKKGVPVSTSQPSIADLTDIWEELLKDYDRIIHIPMAKVLSGGYATAVTFSEEYGGRVLVVDGNRISVTQAALAQYARKLADAGMAASEIKEKLEATCMEAEIYITVESLEYLKRGGRISGAAAMAGELLHVKPVLKLHGGAIEAYGKTRGTKKAKKMIEEAIAKDYERLAGKHGAENVRIFVGHADAREEVLEWAEKWKEMYPDHNIEIARLPLSICCHVGPGTIGAAVCVN